MKHKILCITLSTLLCLGGCGKTTSQKDVSTETKQPVETMNPQQKDVEVDDELYTSYKNQLEAFTMPDSYTARVKRFDDMRYEQDSIQTYNLSGVLEAQDIKENPKGHMSLDIYSNGMDSSMDGWYMNDKFYNVFNGVSYYQDMQFNELEQTMLVPLHPTCIEKEDIYTISREMMAGKEVITVELKKEQCEKYFKTFDAYGFDGYENVDVDHGVLKESFDSKGNWIEESCVFHIGLVQDGIHVDIDVSSDVEVVKQNDTVVRLSETKKKDLLQYVNYEDIDTSKISPYDPNVDSFEGTFEDTLKKRLVHRLNYELVRKDVYKTKFNDSESYEIDFANKTFIYHNHSMSYVYNWKGDTGGFESACSLNFDTDAYTDGCDEQVLDMIRNVKLFFEMELYYCDLSLDQLQSECK